MAFKGWYTKSEREEQAKEQKKREDEIKILHGKHVEDAI